MNLSDQLSSLSKQLKLSAKKIEEQETRIVFLEKLAGTRENKDLGEKKKSRLKSA